MMLAGSTTALRPVQAADLPLLRQWEQEPAVARWMGITSALLDARESAEQEYDRLVRSPRIKLLAIQTRQGEVVGFLRLNDLDLVARKATVRIFVAPDWQNQGHGSEALRILAQHCFDEVGLNRLGLVVRADNTRAIHVYERLGFVAEGRERAAIWSAGGWIDFILMGLLAAEWRGGAR